MKKQEVEFKLDIFEGPLDLLLHLIKNKKLDISELSLIKVANQFVDYVNGSEKINLNESSEYLLLASQLLEIKTKYLISIEEGKNFVKEMEDAENLIKRLIEYERYKKMSEIMFNIYEQNPQLEKNEDDFDDFVINNTEREYKLVSNGVIDIEKALKNIYDSLNNRKVTHSTLKVKRISIEQRKLQLEAYFRVNEGADFLELITENLSKHMIAVTLLCLLEMANSDIILLSQSDNGSIFIKSLIFEN